MQTQLPVTTQPIIPWGTQFTDAAVSTALTIPTPAAGTRLGGTDWVCLLQAVAQTQWISHFGAAVVNACFQMNAQDTMLIYGLQPIKNIRFIHGVGGGGLYAAFFTFRPTPYAGT